MIWKSNIPEIVRLLEDADRQGVVAMQAIVQNEVKRRLRGGYTAGAFVTGNSSNSVTRSEPERTADGHTGKVGTNLLYNLFWEIGHHNIFTRRFERVEVWVPSLFDTRQGQVDAYRRVAGGILGQSIAASASVTRFTEPPEASSGDE